MTVKSIVLLTYVMSSKITTELLKILKEAEKKDPEVKIPIIVAFEHSSFLNEHMLREGGLDVEKIFPSLAIVAGTIAACYIRQFDKLPGVKIIDYDQKFNI